jgi:hypothetical protein
MRFFDLAGFKREREREYSIYLVENKRPLLSLLSTSLSASMAQEWAT